MITPTSQSSPLLFVLNGPNLDLVGQRQPELYGRETLQLVRENPRNFPSNTRCACGY